MNIAVTIKTDETDSFLSEIFGRSDFVLFSDEEFREKRIIRNPFANAFGGAGIQLAQLIIEKNAEVVITKNIGKGALNTLSSGQVKVFYIKDSVQISVRDALELFKENELEEVFTEGCQFRYRHGNKIKRGKNNLHKQ